MPPRPTAWSWAGSPTIRTLTPRLFNSSMRAILSADSFDIPRRRRVLPIGYNSIRSAALDAAMARWEALEAIAGGG